MGEIADGEKRVEGKRVGIRGLEIEDTCCGEKGGGDKEGGWLGVLGGRGRDLWVEVVLASLRLYRLVTQLQLHTGALCLIYTFKYQSAPLLSLLGSCSLPLLVFQLLFSGAHE